MNKILLSQYIQDYKSDFPSINSKEIYKWKAIKCFQTEWNPDAGNFYSMLVASLRMSANLISSGNYYPFAMLLHYADKEPVKIKNILIDLFNEEVDLYERINKYQSETDKIHKEHFKEAKNTYQDHRAVLVYLTLKYPDRYYFYKFGMFKTASKKLQIDLKPIKGRIENVNQYNLLCSQIKHQLSLDQDLIALHKNRLSDDCYFDGNFNILTQDFVFHISSYGIDYPISALPKLNTTISNQVNTAELSSTTDSVNFKGSIVNFIQNNIENKRIGELGELWVIKYEQEKLKRLNSINQLIHTSIIEGDGTGYDILSFDEHSEKIYIEVKTTTGALNNAMFITRNELERSRKEKENYYLYRVYNYNEKTETADLLIIKGELSNLCTTPHTFKVCISEKAAEI